MIEVPVLVVGGSMVGLASSMLLGYHGVPTLCVERHRGTAIHPRAAQISQRTMEILRIVGIEQEVMRASHGQFEQDGAVMAVESLAGKELAYFILNLNEGVRHASPCLRVFITQSLLEPLMRDKAKSFGADLRFGTELVSFEHDDSGVTALIRDRDSGREETVRARYMIAADGSHSPIREKLGIKMHGRGVLSKSVTLYLSGDIAPLLRGRNLSVIYVLNSTLQGFFRFEKPYDRGFLAILSTGDRTNPNMDVWADLTDKRCREYVRAALGEDVPVEIDDVMKWEASALTAECFRDGNIFLAGDAAHVMPPHGGFGGNTGVQDAHNLAWKLARILRGESDPSLLDTYDTERRPIGQLTVEQAYSRFVTRAAPHLVSQGFDPVRPDLEVELEYSYGSAKRVMHDDRFGRDYVMLDGIRIRPDGFTDV